jgi:hypothetical protein
VLPGGLNTAPSELLRVLQKRPCYLMIRASSVCLSDHMVLLSRILVMELAKNLRFLVWSKTVYFNFTTEKLFLFKGISLSV